MSGAAIIRFWSISSTVNCRSRRFINRSKVNGNCGIFRLRHLPRGKKPPFLISETLGWHFVPATIIRNDGPYGAGMLQVFIPHNPEKTYFSLTDTEKQGLKATAVFDLILNNADRKGSHLLFDRTGKLWVIDHGICFHEEAKLRTVVWDFVGAADSRDYP